MPLSN